MSAVKLRSEFAFYYSSKKQKVPNIANYSETFQIVGRVFTVGDF